MQHFKLSVKWHYRCRIQSKHVQLYLSLCPLDGSGAQIQAPLARWAGAVSGWRHAGAVQTWGGEVVWAAAGRPAGLLPRLLCDGAEPGWLAAWWMCSAMQQYWTVLNVSRQAALSVLFSVFLHDRVEFKHHENTVSQSASYYELNE